MTLLVLSRSMLQIFTRIINFYQLKRLVIDRKPTLRMVQLYFITLVYFACFQSFFTVVERKMISNSSVYLIRMVIFSIIFCLLLMNS